MVTKLSIDAPLGKPVMLRALPAVAIVVVWVSGPPSLTSLPLRLRPLLAVVLSGLLMMKELMGAIFLTKPFCTVTRLSVADTPVGNPVILSAVPPVAKVSALALLLMVVGWIRLPPNLTRSVAWRTMNKL